MCGILAITHSRTLDTKRYETARMLETLKHRGPDGHGEYTRKNCWLGHTRLSIIDLAGGTQPMLDGSAADELALSFNGEIYNFRALRAELETLGHNFVTHSDTEVILKSYRQWGTDAVAHLDGMFAFALWDAKQNQLLLARDRFGKKPLYYAFDGDTLVAASEIKALLASGRIEGRLSREALDNYLRLMYIPPWKSVYENVQQIPPAHYGVFKNGKLHLMRYWRLEYHSLSISYNDAKEEVRRLLTDAVKKRMLASDVEVGALLSGGVDSTFICLLAKNYLDHPLKTFSLGYSDYINELPFAEQAAKAIGSEHHTLQASGDMIEEFEKIIPYFDEPHADSSDFPQSLVSGLAASKVKVALSGDGGDELFLGYGWHTRHQNLSYRAHTFEKMFLDPFQGRVRATQIFSPAERLALWSSPFPLNNDLFDDGAYEQGQTVMERINTFDLTTYLPGQLLSKVDRTGMMHSLEVRSPFLDTALAEFVVNLPTEYKAGTNGHKLILKDLLSELMPKEFVNRRKQGFGAPTTKWLREKNMSQYAQEKLGSRASVRSLLSGRIIDFYLNDFYGKQRDRAAMRLWLLLCLELWLDTAKPRL